MAGAPGSAADRLRPVQTVTKNGFETPIRLTKSTAFYAVKALGRDGKVLGTSEAVRRNPRLISSRARRATSSTRGRAPR